MQPKAQINDDVDDIDSEKDEQEWMFRTFDKSKAGPPKQEAPSSDAVVGPGTAYNKF